MATKPITLKSENFSKYPTNSITVQVDNDLSSETTIVVPDTVFPFVITFPSSPYEGKRYISQWLYDYLSGKYNSGNDLDKYLFTLDPLLSPFPQIEMDYNLFINQVFDEREKTSIETIYVPTVDKTKNKIIFPGGLAPVKELEYYGASIADFNSVDPIFLLKWVNLPTKNAQDNSPIQEFPDVLSWGWTPVVGSDLSKPNFYLAVEIKTRTSPLDISDPDSTSINKYYIQITHEPQPQTTATGDIGTTTGGSTSTSTGTTGTTTGGTTGGTTSGTTVTPTADYSVAPFVSNAQSSFNEFLSTPENALAFAAEGPFSTQNIFSSLTDISKQTDLYDMVNFAMSGGGMDDGGAPPMSGADSLADSAKDVADKLSSGLKLPKLPKLPKIPRINLTKIVVIPRVKMKEKKNIKRAKKSKGGFPKIDLNALAKAAAATAKTAAASKLSSMAAVQQASAILASKKSQLSAVKTQQTSITNSLKSIP